MNYDIICFTHLRWSFLYNRPQHLMNRLAVKHRVFFIEEPVFHYLGNESHYEIYHDPTADVRVISPYLPAGLSEPDLLDGKRQSLANLLTDQAIENYIIWYYSPIALTFSNDLTPVYTVFDYVDELSSFLSAAPELVKYTKDLMQKADIVFTSGNSLFLAKRELHPNIYSFPDSIDKSHFQTARTILGDPAEQQTIPHPRIGYYGVIDERLNIALLGQVSALRPDWQFVLIGPIVNIDPDLLPVRENIHYLGPKEYEHLPYYLSGWDIAMMPFGLNDSTRFTSPAKTLEYMAGGKPVVSASIADVVSPYGELGLVHLADTAEEFVDIADELMQHGVDAGWLSSVDSFLAGRSWERTVNDMETLIEKGISRKIGPSAQPGGAYDPAITVDRPSDFNVYRS